MLGILTIFLAYIICIGLQYFSNELCSDKSWNISNLALFITFHRRLIRRANSVGKSEWIACYLYRYVVLGVLMTTLCWGFLWRHYMVIMSAGLTLTTDYFFSVLKISCSNSITTSRGNDFELVIHFQWLCMKSSKKFIALTRCIAL